MKRNTRITLGIILLAVLGAAAWWMANRGEEVETIQVRQGSLTRTVSDNGYVQPSTDYSLNATQTARVIEVPVKTGEFVKQGQTLVVMENLDLAVQISDLHSQLAQASTSAAGARAALERIQLELKDAGENLARTQELYQAGVATKVEHDKARLLLETTQQNLNEQTYLLDSAQAQQEGLSQSLRQLNAKEQQLVVKSPVDGTIMSLPVKQEQVLSPGTLLVNVAVSNMLEIKADILSDDLADVKTGQKCSITAPVLGERVLVGEVTKIYPQAEEKQSALGIIQRRVPVIISLSEPANLKPGFEVKVAIETLSRQNTLVLPREAVRTTTDGHKEVMAVVNNQVKHQQLQTGISDQDSIEIISGLAAGDLVVKDSSLDLAEGLRIKPADKE